MKRIYASFGRFILVGMSLTSLVLSFSYAQGEERLTERRFGQPENLTEPKDFTGLLGYEPYEPNIFSLIKDDNNYSFLYQLVQAAGLSTLLKENKKFTVFAPTDAAFAKLPSSTINELINPFNKEKLAEVLKNHIVEVKLLPDELQNSQVKNLNGSELNIEALDNVITVNNAKIINKGTAAANGIIYGIDTVIMPQKP